MVVFVYVAFFQFQTPLNLNTLHNFVAFSGLLNMSEIDANVNSVIKTLVKNYFKGSLAFSIEPENAAIMTWTIQKELLDATIHSELLQRYPVKNEFAKLYFKKLISAIEPYQEVHDDMYQYLCSAMKNETKDMFCYRHYIIDDDIDNVITMKETNNMVVNGTTGMRTWEAALMLADWALCNKDKFFNKKVLEIGSGVGFTGIIIAKHCNTESIVLTDCHDDVLRTIKDNIDINFPPPVNDKDFKQECKPKIDIMMLDWNDDDGIPTELVPDVVIGADIVYDPSILQILCNVLRKFFDKNDNLEVFIASMIRNEDTFYEFLRTLENNNFTYCEVPLEYIKIIEWDYANKQRSLLKILRYK